MASSLPAYQSDQQQQPQAQAELQSRTNTAYHSNNPFLNAQPTGASVQSNVTAPPSFNEATGIVNQQTDNSSISNIPSQSTGTATGAGSNPFDTLSELDPEQHLTESTSTANQAQTGSASVQSETRLNTDHSNSIVIQPTSTSPIHPSRSPSAPSSPESASLTHSRPNRTLTPSPPLIIPPDADNPPDSVSTTATISSTTIYDPPSSPPPPISSPSYRPPPGPPPQLPNRRTPSQSSNANSPIGNQQTGNGGLPQGYHPTTVATPGQPLLRNGKILIYPRGWQGCPKCQDTGYKRFDPTHPCRKCWERYSRPLSGALSYSLGLEGGQILQKPLPTRHSQSYRQGFMGRPPSHSNVPSGFPAHAQSQFQPQPQAPYYPNQQQFNQPPHHPNTHFRPPSGPPAVNRAETANEEDVDGDAPPAYNETVSSNGRPLPPQHSGASSSSSNSGFRPPSGPPPMVPPRHGGSYGPYQQTQPYHHGPPPGHFSHPHQPPQRPLVLSPGDPRIGGHLCYKCGGRGLKESFWLGDETCYVCRGLGRTGI